jgi:hypothetical protein
MIDALRGFDAKTAAGILARAALALESAGNPAAHPMLPNEDNLRAEIMQEARSQVGIGPADDGADAIERLCDYLDDQSDRLLGPDDTEAALRRLAERGNLPSDLYEVDFAIAPIVRYLGKRFDLERRLVVTTIRSPLREQHYGRSKSIKEPSLISLFAHRFKTKWPFKDFTMLVAAAREGLRLDVQQAWRLYESEVDTRNAHDLVDLLRRFAAKYGSEIEVSGQRGSFFLFSETPAPTSYTVRMGAGRPRTITVSQFMQRDPPTDPPKAALIISVYTELYINTLDKMSVNSDEILDELFIVTRRVLLSTRV